MFLVDERVVYDMEIGRIQAINERVIAGQIITAYDLYLYTRPNVKIAVPIFKSSNMRRLASQQDVENLIERLKNPHGNVLPKMHWKKSLRLRKEMATSLSFSERCDTYISLRHQDKMSMSEQDLLDIVEKLIVCEASFILSKPKEDIQQLFDDAVAYSKMSAKDIRMLSN